MSLLFTVELTNSSDRGVTVIGNAPHPETPIPKKGELVEVRNPDGSTFLAEVSGMDVTFSSRSCFGQKTVKRAVLIEHHKTATVLAGAQIRSLPHGDF